VALVAWLAYLVVVLWLYTRPIKPAGRPAVAPSQPAVGS
jgi:hypothetical protein